MQHRKGWSYRLAAEFSPPCRHLLALSYRSSACLKSIDKHLTDLRNQRVINLDSVHVYEPAGRAQKPVAENRFGMMYDTPPNSTARRRTH
jgi:hypothetical protein